MINVAICPLCRKKVDSVEHIAEQWLLSEIRKEYPSWVESNGVSSKCVAYYRNLDNLLKLADEHN